MQKLKLISCIMMFTMPLRAYMSKPSIQNPKQIQPKTEAMKAPYGLVK
ncbi:hypothetical protein NVI2019_NGLDDFDA_03901 (plasmid) [Providencia alcalifaciens]|nr:hypothetical protein NVI2019_NGLDDFDA_03901 [Providencia alcalifaciens]